MKVGVAMFSAVKPEKPCLRMVLKVSKTGF